MYAFFEKKYPATLLNPHLIVSNDVVKISYSARLFPDFFQDLSSAAMSGNFILYQDAMQECKLKVEQITISGPVTFGDENEENSDGEADDICPTERTYGEQANIISSLPLVKRKYFLSGEVVAVIEVAECIDL